MKLQANYFMCFQMLKVENKKLYLIEFIGTFLLVFIGTGSIIISEEYEGILQTFGVGVVFGLTVWLFIQLCRRFSDCHINPAVTISFLVAKKITFLKAINYILLQLTGALLASFVLHLCFANNKNLGNTLPRGTLEESFVIEFFLSFALLMVILIVSSVEKFLKFAPFLIGFTVFLAAWLAGPVSGASMNPARSFGPAIVSGNLNSLWLYFVAPIFGMLLSLLIYAVVKKKFK